MQQSAIIDFLSGHQWIIPVIITWSLIWKGIALWKAARNKSLPWFVAILIINTLGILEIIYVAFFSGKKAVPEKKDEEKIA